MKTHITPFDLVEPITAVHVDQGRQELIAVLIHGLRFEPLGQSTS